MACLKSQARFEINMRFVLTCHHKVASLFKEALMLFQTIDCITNGHSLCDITRLFLVLPELDSSGHVISSTF